MRLKRKLIIFICLVIFGIIGGYFYLKRYESKQNLPSSGVINQRGTENKVGETSLSGTLIQQGDEFFISRSGEEPTSLDSYDIKLNRYIGKEVTVTGQYSGDTLFVKEVEIE
jgi:hypothetical protein